MKAYKRFMGFLRGEQSTASKVFCIGRNKTGTTSLKQAATDLGFRVGNQSKAEPLFQDYLKRDFNSLISYCRTGDFFQDVPFNLPYVYPVLDHTFPNAKFILSIRGSAEEWYESFIRFQIKVNSSQQALPTKEQLLSNNRVFPGFAYWTKNDVFRTPDDDIYNKEKLITHYNNYNNDVIHYFRFKKNLLVINVSEGDAYKKFCDFLEKRPVYDHMPWENKNSQV
jgi:hypothetical protein